MNEKTFKNKLTALLEESTDELEKYVLSDLLENDELFLKDVLNHGCVSGTVGQLVYFSDTKAFYIKFIDEIESLKEELEEEIGEPLKMNFPNYNWLAWFGYEETARRIAEKLGLEM